jgi:hypothetical protein
VQRTYRALKVMAALAIPAAIYNLFFAMRWLWLLAPFAYSSLPIRLALVILAVVCAELVAGTVALAVVVAARTGRRGWLVALLIVGAVVVYWQAVVQLYIILPQDANPVEELVGSLSSALLGRGWYLFGALLPLAIPAFTPLIAAGLVLAFTRRGQRAGAHQGEQRAFDARGAHGALAVAAGLAFVARALIPMAFQALGSAAVLRILSGGVQVSDIGVALQAFLGNLVIRTGDALVVGVVVATLCVAAWTGRRRWLAALAALACLAIIVPALQHYQEWFSTQWVVTVPLVPDSDVSVLTVLLVPGAALHLSPPPAFWVEGAAQIVIFYALPLAFALTGWRRASLANAVR